MPIKIYRDDVTTWEEQMHVVPDCDVCTLYPDARKNREGIMNQLTTNVCLRCKKAACHKKFREQNYDGTLSRKALIMRKLPPLRSRLCKNKSSGLLRRKKILDG